MLQNRQLAENFASVWFLTQNYEKIAALPRKRSDTLNLEKAVGTRVAEPDHTAATTLGAVIIILVKIHGENVTVIRLMHLLRLVLVFLRSRLSHRPALQAFIAHRQRLLA